MAQCRVVYELFDIEKCCVLEILKSSFEVFGLVVYGDLETRVSGHSRSLNMIMFDRTTHEFVLTFYSNRRPISHRFRDKRRIPSKI